MLTWTETFTHTIHFFKEEELNLNVIEVIPWIYLLQWLSSPNPQNKNDRVWASTEFEIELIPNS